MTTTITADNNDKYKDYVKKTLAGLMTFNIQNYYRKL